MIKFNKYNVTDTETKTKARVHYSLDNRVDGRKCVTIYHKDYNDNLVKIFGDIVIDDTDSMTDYFEKGRVVLFEDNALYAAARARAEGKAPAPAAPAAPAPAEAKEAFKVVEEYGDGTEIQDAYFYSIEDAKQFASTCLNRNCYQGAKIREHAGGYHTEKLITRTVKGELGDTYEVSELSRRNIVISRIEIK